jgi:isocitrate dehydrogenase kinase/phosphatase
MSIHADLFTSQYWNKIKDNLTAGKMLDVFPYPESLRFGADGWCST